MVDLLELLELLLWRCNGETTQDGRGFAREGKRVGRFVNEFEKKKGPKKK
jgi:hypothetical protein